MKDLLLAIVKELVDYPDQVAVKEIVGTSTVMLELSVAKQDLGMVIGQKGKNISAIRIIIQGAAAKRKKRAIIELIE